MMNLKYYLRGLGIGIIVTALIMGITTGGKEKLSNAEIRERAKALGMVEEGTLLETSEISQEQADEMPEKKPEEQKTEEPKAEDVSKPVNAEDVVKPEDTSDVTSDDEEWKEPEESPKAVTTPDDTPDVADEAAETPSEMTDDQETPEADEPEQIQESEEEKRPATGSVTLQIARGDGSYSVCKKLEEAGLIESATEYDMFLYQNGYDKKIRAGTFEIPADANGEKIARIITGLE